jgi:hypothetical protein
MSIGERDPNAEYVAGGFRYETKVGSGTMAWMRDGAQVTAAVSLRGDVVLLVLDEVRRLKSELAKEKAIKVELSKLVDTIREIFRLHVVVENSTILSAARNIAVNAERWMKLLACPRIRVMGTASLGRPNGHIEVGLWGRHPSSDSPETGGKRIMEKFVDGLDHLKGPLF